MRSIALTAFGRVPAPPGSVQTQIAHFRFEPVEGFIALVDHDRLCIKVMVERFLAELASGTGILDATPWRRRVDPVMIVDPDDAGFQILGKAMRACNIVG